MTSGRFVQQSLKKLCEDGLLSDLIGDLKKACEGDVLRDLNIDIKKVRENGHLSEKNCRDMLHTPVIPFAGNDFLDRAIEEWTTRLAPATDKCSASALPPVLAALTVDLSPEMEERLKRLAGRVRDRLQAKVDEPHRSGLDQLDPFHFLINPVSSAQCRPPFLEFTTNVTTSLKDEIVNDEMVLGCSGYREEELERLVLDFLSNLPIRSAWDGIFKLDHRIWGPDEHVLKVGPSECKPQTASIPTRRPT